MSLSNICIKRPVFATVMTLILVLVGLVYFFNLPVRHYPAVDRPIISVKTDYEGASPEIIEGRVTKPIENALFGIEGIDFMTSDSRAEQSVVKIFFNVDRPLDNAANDVRDRLSRVRRQLPDGAQAPTIQKADADSEPIIMLVFSSENIPIEEITDFVDRNVKSEMEAIPGVASVDLFGQQDKVVHIWLDPQKMASYQITVQDVINALKKQNVNLPAGRITTGDREYYINTIANLKSAEEFNGINIKFHEGFLVRLADLGRVEFSAQEERSKIFYNGRRAVALGIVKKSVGNPLEIAKSLRKIMPKVQATLPAGVQGEIATDSTVFIKKSIDEVYKTILEATLFVLIVIALFLWSLRASLIPLVTIPVSLIATFTLLSLFGFTINSLTLLAMVLAIGLVVDDAIVVMENVHRYIEKGYSPIKAAVIGTKEISMAVVAMTLTLAAVYAPIALIPGFTGKLFIEFALTLAGAVIISGFTALTLSPMMCSRLLKPHNPNAPRTINDRFLSKLETGYSSALTLLLGKRLFVLIVGLSVSLGGVFIGKFALDSELAPKEDKGMIFGRGLAPQSATLDYVSRYMEQVDAVIASSPEVENRLVIVDAQRPYSRNILKPFSDRKKSSTKIVEDLKPLLENIAGIRAYASVGGSLIGASGQSDDSLEFVIQTTQSYEDLAKVGADIERKMHQSKKFLFIQHDIGIETQDYAVRINRDKAATLGVELATIGETLDALVKGKVATQFRLDTEEYKVITEIEGAIRQSPEDLNNIYVRGHKDTQVPLGNLITIERRSMPVERHHYNKLRSVSVTAKLRPGVSTGEAVDFVSAFKNDLPDHIRTSFTGQTKRFIDSKNTIYFIFGLAILFIYLVMSAQFESFKDPFIIILSVPLSIAGALFTLWVVGGTLNIYSQIGLVTLIGLITKHGILIVDFANSRFEQTQDLVASVVEASKARLRPILMTTAAMVLGALPLAIASGAGAESRQQIGWVIVGGMLFGTLFTLFVLPAVYTLFPRKPQRFLSDEEMSV